MTPAQLLLLNAALALVLLGLILTIQFVHYPAFADVGEASFGNFHRLHSLRITPLVGPLMVAEALAALALVMHRPDALPAWAAWAAGLLVVVVWLDTMLWAVPVHGRLGAGPDRELVAELLRANALRAIAWGARCALLTPFVLRLVR
jgi:hypothetical protein